MRKKLFSVIITLAMVLSITACGKGGDVTDTDNSNTANSNKSDYSSVVYEVVEPDVNEEDVQKQLERVREHSYKRIPTDRKVVKEGDIITISLSGTINGLPLGELATEEIVYTNRKDEYLPDFINNCIGAELGVEKEFDVEFPDSEDFVLSGKKVTYKLTVTEITEVGSFEIDDELAKHCGFETLDDLIWDIKLTLSGDSEDNIKFQTKLNALKAYADVYKIKADNAEIEKALQKELDALEELISIQETEEIEIDTKQYVLDNYEMTYDEYVAYLRESCEASEYYKKVTDDIIKRENITLTLELKAEALDRLSNEYKQSIESLQNSVTEEELNDKILRDVAYHLMLETAVKK